MTITNHTPAPWRYVRENGSPTTGQHMIAGATAGYIAEVRDCGSGDVTANANLITAAPDLLEALRDARDLIEVLTPIECDTMRRISAAINKATGKHSS